MNTMYEIRDNESGLSLEKDVPEEDVCGSLDEWKAIYPQAALAAVPQGRATYCAA